MSPTSAEFESSKVALPLKLFWFKRSKISEKQFAEEMQNMLVDRINHNYYVYKMVSLDVLILKTRNNYAHIYSCHFVLLLQIRSIC